MYEYLLKSNFVNTNYKRIQQDEQSSGTARHDISHALNVVKLVESVLVQLNVDKAYIEAAKIAALLHDLGCVHGKKGHAMNSYLMVKQYLEENDMNLLYENEILNAIKHHGSGYDRDELMTLVLILCDKIDLTKHRLAPEGYETIGIRQLQYIQNVNVFIGHQKCVVEFEAVGEIDLDELNGFEFLDKTFKSIIAFARFNRLEPRILINGVIWDRKSIL